MLPSRHGAQYLAEWAEREDISLIVVPARYVHPSLMDRLRGETLERLLVRTDRAVAVVGEDGQADVPRAAA